jgi:putative heme-binding domain-containing protein
LHAPSDSARADARRGSPDPASARADYLQGALDALADRGNQKPPADWAELYKLTASSSNAAMRSTVVRLATIFGDKRAIDKLRSAVLDEKIAVEKRQESLQALLRVENGVPVSLLHDLTQTQSPIRQDAIRALSLHSNKSTPSVLLSAYAALSSAEQQDAIAVLTTQLDFASSLLQSIREKKLKTQDVSAFALQQLRAFNNESLNKQIKVLWANDTTKLKKSDEITRFKKLLTADYLKTGNAAHGRAIFEKTCAKCHTLFGQGANIGPDLTGSGRKKLDYVLSNLVDPSAIIDPAYRLTVVITNKGKLLTGFMVHQDDHAVVIRTQQAQIRLVMKDIDELKTLDVSMMPENMLSKYTNEQVRDLVLYLSSDDQVPRALE